MAGRTLNRHEMRRQADAAEILETGPEKKTGAKAAAGPKVKKPRAKKAPPRVCVRWGVFDSTMKQVALFDYSQRAAAEEKLAALLANKKGGYVLQLVKGPMPEPAPALATSVV